MLTKRFLNNQSDQSVTTKAVHAASICIMGPALQHLTLTLRSLASFGPSKRMISFVMTFMGLKRDFCCCSASVAFHCSLQVRLGVKYLWTFELTIFLRIFPSTI